MRALHTLALTVLLVVWLPATGVTVAAGTVSQPEERPNPCVGTITETPDEETLVSIQGTHLVDGEDEKRPAVGAVAVFSVVGAVGAALYRYRD